MNTAVRILLVDDVPEDAERTQRQLRAAFPATEVLQVSTRDEYLAALQSFAPDIILANFLLPDFAGMTALQLAKELRPGVPFLFVTTPTDEETAVECMKAGAWDYILKDQLTRMGPAVQEALEEKQERELSQESENRLRIQHEKLQVLFRQVESAKREWETTMDCVDDIVILTDAQNRIRRCNKALATLTEWKFQELLGREWEGLCDTLQLRETEAGAAGPELFHAPTARSFLSCVYPLPLTGNMPTGSVITLHDISQRKQMTAKLEKKNDELARAYEELKTSQAQLLQQGKMASIGVLAAGVAHEINNPIGFITSNLGTLQNYMKRLAEFLHLQSEAIQQHGSLAQGCAQDLAEARKKLKIDHLLNDIPPLIQESLDGAGRVKTIVQNLKNFSRVDQALRSQSDINQCLEETLNIIRNELKYKCEVKKEYGELPLLWCYPQQLNQVFMNILLNAVQSMESKGEITIRTWADATDIHIMVEDTGCGIPAENLPRLFEPFFTTKEVGKGTGLGLSIVYDIITKQHGGDITVTSEVDKGSTFWLRLPQLKE